MREDKSKWHVQKYLCDSSTSSWRQMASFMWQWEPDCRLSRMLTALPSWKVPEPPTGENNHNISIIFQRILPLAWNWPSMLHSTYKTKEFLPESSERKGGILFLLICSLFMFWPSYKCKFNHRHHNLLIHLNKTNYLSGAVLPASQKHFFNNIFIGLLCAKYFSMWLNHTACLVLTTTLKRCCFYFACFTDGETDSEWLNNLVKW